MHLSRLRDRRAILSEGLWSLVTRTWDQAYDGDAQSIGRFTVARIEAVMTERGRKPVVECRLDCVVTFERIPLDQITVVNPLRTAVVREGGYPKLREMLKDPAYDSVPISAAYSGGAFIVWDGHHRLETYQAAGRPDVPAWVARFVRGTGEIILPGTSPSS